jgi:hypothetical protein
LLFSRVAVKSTGNGIADFLISKKPLPLHSQKPIENDKADISALEQEEKEQTRIP